MYGWEKSSSVVLDSLLVGGTLHTCFSDVVHAVVGARCYARNDMIVGFFPACLNK